jgi:hypothetical protein
MQLDGLKVGQVVAGAIEILIWVKAEEEAG